MSSRTGSFIRREGSYTNYLFEKGIDKILKKWAEECTEIVIAAKNPNPEEIKYEIADFSITAWCSWLKKESPGRISQRNWLTEDKRYIVGQPPESFRRLFCIRRFSAA